MNQGILHMQDYLFRAFVALLLTLFATYKEYDLLKYEKEKREPTSADVIMYLFFVCAKGYASLMGGAGLAMFAALMLKLHSSYVPPHGQIVLAFFISVLSVAALIGVAQNIVCYFKGRPPTKIISLKLLLKAWFGIKSKPE